MGTRFISRHWGETFPFYHVIEYPKSGGTWLAKLIADYLQIPKPMTPLLPVAFTCVLQGHWRYDRRYKNVWYLYRDGRDVMISLYFHRMREMAANPGSLDGRYARGVYPRLFGPAFNPADIRANLPKFIEHEALNPKSSYVNWSRHCDMWLEDSSVAGLRYEDLIADTVGTVARVLPRHVPGDVDHERLAASVKKFSFESQSGRKRGQEDAASFLRKGVAGDWKNHFTREAAKVFDHFHGRTLVQLGYERSQDWVASMPAIAPLQQTLTAAKNEIAA